MVAAAVAGRSIGQRSIGICVDDLGLVGGVADTVVALASARRISAASCIVNAPASAGDLRAVATQANALPRFELGLHLNLTEGSPLSPDLAAVWPTLPGLARLIVAAHLGRLPLRALAVEWQAQFDAFCEAVGRAPRFIDGHQHVHHLPGIRKLVLAAAATGPDGPAFRNTGHVVGPGFVVKRMLIERSGGRSLQMELTARGLRCNRTLLGVYDFRLRDYRSLFRGWLAVAPDVGALVFCHPDRGEPSRHGSDAIADARQREAAYLGSDNFADDLAEAGFTVGPSWQSSSGG